jgi:hypothetical protein
MADRSLWVFFFLTVVLGGGAAWLMGRNFATNWRPVRSVALASLGLALGVHFLHYALFQEDLASIVGYIAEAAVLMILALLAFRHRRAEQMATQYFWLYERNGPFGWRQRAAQGAGVKTDDNAGD